ncbi:hypothetical protein [Kineococcus rhizosphaerae]|uniref:Uncharacterized protein n=1 Tax=Kineococcus rhizosphaerae TaxID=559628 RepID=A0A2T0R8J2_9ACTN|nr:hypothetical protein [Kineococcus rhizosphaerae]PRY17495.1 hypothetical protein CLV37_102458 [Kineococcus rhizosphaerae]
MPPTPDDGSGPLDVDAAFAEIVARWGEDVPDPENLDDEARDQGEDQGPRHLAAPDEQDGAGDEAAAGPGPEDRSRLVRPAAPLPPPPREDVPATGSFATPRQRDDEPIELRSLSEESFVPADPAPLPRDVLGWAAWIAVVGAPLFLLVVALSWQDVPQLLTAITAAVFVAGFATLVVRLPSSRDDDDDDGAVV